jgi:predicted AlkP superfamily phosphohydrolase/phosphomutase
VPNNTLYGGIRINLKGREPRGVIAPGAQADELIATLRREFQLLTDPESGRPIVRDLLRTSELHPGPALNDLPDLLVDWIRTEPIAGASSATIGTVHAPYTGARTGDHRPTGLLIACGPGIEPRRGSTPVRSVDLAPTVAALLGVDLAGVEGKPITELVSVQR